MVEKIYFDMDGVLADFERGVRELCGMEPAPQGPAWKPGCDDEMWQMWVVSQPRWEVADGS